MTDFKVQPTELQSASETFDQLGSALDALSDSLASVPISSGDFGRLPGQGGLAAAYESGRQQCEEGLHESARSAQGLSKGLATTGKLYEGVEQQAIEAINSFFGGV